MWKAMGEQKEEGGAALRYNNNDGVPHNHHLDAFYGTDPSSCMIEERVAHRCEDPSEDEYMDSTSAKMDCDFSYESTYH
jgi:hypothetical protein